MGIGVAELFPGEALLNVESSSKHYGVWTYELCWNTGSVRVDSDFSSPCSVALVVSAIACKGMRRVHLGIPRP